MTANLILLLVSVLIIAIVLFVRVYNPGADTSAYYRYYSMSSLLIGSMLGVIALFRLIHGLMRRNITPEPHPSAIANERRDGYRLVFDSPPRPVFLQKSDGPGSVPVFTCPVWDVSETGVSLDCTRVYTNGQTVQGEIIFDSGRTVTVNGVVNRSGSRRTALMLHCTIDPAVIMAEQRERITLKKKAGPRPVGDAFSDESHGFLPSHQPKGICRRNQSEK
jgi:hypothetical protein